MRSSRARHILVILTTVLALFLRCVGQTESSYTPAEAPIVYWASPPAAAGREPPAPVPVPVPVRSWLVPASVLRAFVLMGLPAAEWHLTAALPAVGSVLVLGALASRVLAPPVGVLATVLWACAPVSVEMGRSLDPRSWAVFLSLLGLYALAVALQTGSRVAWAMNALVLLAASLVTPLAVALGLAQCVLAVRAGARRAIVVTGAICVLLVVSFLIVPLSFRPELVRLQWEWWPFLGLGSKVWWVVLLSGALAGWGSAVRPERPHMDVLRGFVPVCAVGAALGAAAVWQFTTEYRDTDRAVLSAFLAVLVAAAIGWGWKRGATTTPLRVLTIAAVTGLAAGWFPVVRDALLPPADWRAVAEIVRKNATPAERIVVAADRTTFLLHAPDLAWRVEPQYSPGRSLAYFGNIPRGWFIVPRQVRLYPAWPRIAHWVEQFRVVDLSPDPRIHLFYFAAKGRPAAMQRVAVFDLPAATLARGSLLLELARDQGPSAGVLWKVDQLVLWRTPHFEQNPSLIETVLLLAERGFGDRAASLAYTLAKSDPQWAAAQSLDGRIRGKEQGAGR